MTEQEAAQLLEDYLKHHSTEHYLHRAFAWFGEHSRRLWLDDDVPHVIEARRNDQADWQQKQESSSCSACLYRWKQRTPSSRCRRANGR